MRRRLAGQVVVLTGASSGIGLCTARYLAVRGCRLVLTARSADALAQVRHELVEGGAEAEAVPADVTSESELRRVADTAVERFGRIDTWVNGAAVYAQAGVSDLPLDDYRRLIDVNLVGTINGTRQALRVMRRQGEGVVVQVSSIVALRGAPWASAYSATKQGVDGFTEGVRAELWGTGVRVSTLYLPAVDTPIYQHAAARLGTVPQPPPPVADPERVAAAIAGLARTGRRHQHVGRFHLLYAGPNRISPALGDWFVQHTVEFTRSGRPAGSNNLHEPTGLPPRVRGGWRQRGWRGVTLTDTVRVLPVETALGAAALLLGAVWSGRKLWNHVRG
ncbi:MAG: SDR family oxidoreductase [Gemmatimonadota bacterium]|nr:SDR family NAD(P)-dependent oxidoreductase [Gemmatimonadota bacterium]